MNVESLQEKHSKTCFVNSVIEDITFLLDLYSMGYKHYIWIVSYLKVGEQHSCTL